MGGWTEGGAGGSDGRTVSKPSEMVPTNLEIVTSGARILSSSCRE